MWNGPTPSGLSFKDDSSCQINVIVAASPKEMVNPQCGWNIFWLNVLTLY